ncbi:MAG: ferritin [Candidatus Liberibacter ctenarytainae]|uniref:Ferritin n=1 Tax=Candidatus Liberibacter ctenarytainae TaxID=2020335 RepID=A0A937ABF1_9HYPH|nr:ferritin [Candidatus Liberibacter ctenarytainae]
MSNPKIQTLLNQTMNIELRAQYYYLQASAWAANHNFSGCHDFLLKHADEEHLHAMKIFRYIIDLGEDATFSDIPQPIIKASSIEELFSHVYQHEIDVTKAYDQAIETVLAEKDNQTFAFLQWFVNEQAEELTQCRRILDTIKIIGSGPHSLYMIDQEVAKIAGEST